MRIIIFLLSLSYCFNIVSQEDLILNPEQMQKDISVLESAFLNLHPGLYKFNTPEQISIMFSELKNEITVPLTEKAYFLMLSKFAEKIKCGHTYMNIYNQKKKIKQRIYPDKTIPFFFVIVESKIIITHNLSDNLKIKKGDEITQINGYSSRQIIDSLLTVSRSDGRNSLNKKINNINITPDEANELTLFDIYFPLFFKTNGAYTLEVKHYKNNELMKYTVSPVSVTSRKDTFEQQFGKIPVYENTWDYKQINESTAYMKFGTFAFWNSKFNTKKYIDSIFNDVNSKKEITDLIIDIRGNEGGDDTYEYILSYITQKEIGCEKTKKVLHKFLTIPDSLLEYLNTWDESFKSPKDPNKFIRNEMGLYEEINLADCDAIKPQKDPFTGRVYLLTDAKNSSAGFQMAEIFNSAGLGIIAGEATGGSRMGITGGFFFFLYLPGSELEIDLPLKWGYYPDQPDQGIIPDIEIITKQDDIAEGRDAQLSTILNIIAIKK